MPATPGARRPADRFAAFWRLLTGCLLCLGTVGLNQKFSAAVPKGVFSLSETGSPCSPLILANPNVDGVSVRQDWKDLEPTEGTYDWSFLDSEVARVAAAGKQVLLRINTQDGKSESVTTAVTEAGGLFFTFDAEGVQTTIPVFWDPTLLAKKEAFVVALGAALHQQSRDRSCVV